MATLEHINLTVSDPEQTAQLLCTLFDWQIRWAGEAKDGGYTVHVGQPFEDPSPISSSLPSNRQANVSSYIALYTSRRPSRPAKLTHHSIGHINHLAVTVEDLDETEKRILAAGFTTTNHADYAPGRRFYFYLPDEIEVEVVSYAQAIDTKLPGEIIATGDEPVDQQAHARGQESVLGIKRVDSTFWRGLILR